MSSVLSSSQNVGTRKGAAEIGAAVVGAAGGGTAMEKVSSFFGSQWNTDMEPPSTHSSVERHAIPELPHMTLNSSRFRERSRSLVPSADARGSLAVEP